MNILYSCGKLSQTQKIPIITKNKHNQCNPTSGAWEGRMYANLTPYIPPDGVVCSGLVRPPQKNGSKTNKKMYRTNEGLPVMYYREVGMMSSLHDPYGPHTCYEGNYNEKQCCKAERIQKDCLSSDCSPQLRNMKLETLVLAGCMPQ